MMWPLSQPEIRPWQWNVMWNVNQEALIFSHSQFHSLVAMNSSMCWYHYKNCLTTGWRTRQTNASCEGRTRSGWGTRAALLDVTHLNSWMVEWGAYSMECTFATFISDIFITLYFIYFPHNFYSLTLFFS